MEEKILSMISVYSEKISKTEILLHATETEIEKARRESKCYVPLTIGYARLLAKLTTYQQAKVDFETLQSHFEHD